MLVLLLCVLSVESDVRKVELIILLRLWALVVPWAEQPSPVNFQVFVPIPCCSPHSPVDVLSFCFHVFLEGVVLGCTTSVSTKGVMLYASFTNISH